MKTIALTCSTETDKLFLRPRYIDWILQSAEKCGVSVLPVILPATADENVIRGYARMFDGYLFTGGDDIDPALYGEEKHEKCGNIEPERDLFELALLRELISADRPVFGICRGIQVMNVALGGTLWQDHYSQVTRKKPHAEKDVSGTPRHRVQTSGFLREITDSEWITANSYHHQAVKIPGNGLTVCGMSEDGIIEAIAHDTLTFFRAVQWHPEIGVDEISVKLFAHFFDNL